MCTPLSSSSLAAVEYGHLRLKHSDWVLQTAKKFIVYLGPYVGYEEQFMVILVVIEAIRSHTVLGGVKKIGMLYKLWF